MLLKKQQKTKKRCCVEKKLLKNQQNKKLSNKFCLKKYKIFFNKCVVVGFVNKLYNKWLWFLCCNLWLFAFNLFSNK